VYRRLFLTHRNKSPIIANLFLEIREVEIIERQGDNLYKTKITKNI